MAVKLEDRRQVLRLVGSAVAFAAGAGAWAQAAKRTKAKVAILLPLSGASASLGLSMQRAAALVPASDPKSEPPIVLDTGGTPEGATAAARQAMKRGATIILGPLYSPEVAAVVAVVGREFPVLSFSNDEALASSGAFLLGVTATQSVSAILAYARRRGVRRVVAFGGETPWSRQGMAAAQRVKDSLGIELALLPAPLFAGQGLPDALRKIGKGDLPDALLVTDGGATLETAGRALAGSGVQLLGSQPSENAAAVAGAWVAGSDPAAQADFANRYQWRYGAVPGSLAALAYDGASIVEGLRGGGVVDRAALSSASSSGVAGPIRFRADGTAVRELAILVAGERGYSAVDKSPTA